MWRHSCGEKQKLRKGLWSPEEDEKLYNHITKFGVGCWSSVPKLAGLQRCGKSCRLRWINYLRPDLKRGTFSQEEEDLIISLHEALGNRWAQIAAQLPGRTDNEIKNFWNSCLKKKLMKQGIDPNTHKPISQGEAWNDNSRSDEASLQVSQVRGQVEMGLPFLLDNTSYYPDHAQIGTVSKQIFDPWFLFEFPANADHVRNNSNFFTDHYCQQHPGAYDRKDFDSTEKLMNLDHVNMTDMDCSEGSTSRIDSFLIHEAKECISNSHSGMLQMSYMEENTSLSYDAENKFESLLQYQTNGCIKAEGFVKPDNHTWQGQLQTQNSEYLSGNQMLTTLSEDLSEANFDVFDQI